MVNTAETSEAAAVAVSRHGRTSSTYSYSRKDTDTFVLHNRLLCDVNYILEQPVKAASSPSNKGNVISEEGLVRCGDSVALDRFDTTYSLTYSLTHSLTYSGSTPV